MEIGVLGPLDVHSGGKPQQLGGPKQRAVFGLLVAGSDRTVSVDEIVEGVWRDAPPRAVLSSDRRFIARAVEQHDPWEGGRRHRRRTLTRSFAMATGFASLLAGAAWVQRARKDCV